MNPNQTTPTPTLNWVALPGAVNYDVWIDNVSTNQSQFVRNMNVVGTSFTPPSNLPMDSYRAWVRGKDASGLAAQWSVPVNFRVLLPVTVLAGPASTFDRTPTFSWNAVSGAVSYDLDYRNHSTGTASVAQTGIAGTSFMPAADLPTGSYRWYVLVVVPGPYRSQSARLPKLVHGVCRSTSRSLPFQGNRIRSSCWIKCCWPV